MNKKPFYLVHEAARRGAAELLAKCPDGWSVLFKEPARNLSQNAAQWPILAAFSKQVQWPVNGEMVYMSPDEWKDVLTAAFEKQQARVAMGWDGGMVMLGARTSNYSKTRFSEWLEFLNAAAAIKGVNLER